jgi:4-carboxymuconolactone decarboxylase
MRSLIAAALLAAALPLITATAEPAALITVVPPGTDPQPGPAETFTGSVSAASRFKGTGGSRLGGATVTFQPGARTHWHSHPLGQLLVVTAGEGRVQDRGGSLRVIRADDTVWTAPGAEHWHGAAPDAAMSHVAIAEAVGGKVVDWGDPVPDAIYLAPASR